MALIEEYGSSNRVIDQGKVVTYSKVKTYNRYSYLSGVNEITTIGHEYEYTRFCTKSYRYVGMTKAAAEECAEDMVALYTRTTKTSEWIASGTGAGSFADSTAGSQIMAKVAVIHNAGRMYSVRVDVNETDVRIRTTATHDFESLFSSENARDYDED